MEGVRVSDCSTNAFDAKPIRGQLVYEDGRPSEFTFARYVNGEERVVDHVTVDGLNYEPVNK